MHSVHLYCKGPHGPVPVARATVDGDAHLEVRMEDGTILSSLSLEQWGYEQLFKFPSPLIRPCQHDPLA